MKSGPSVTAWSTAAAAAAVIGLMFCACSPKANSAAIGRWQADAGGTIEFRDDGTLRGKDQYGRALTGTFELVAPDRIHIKTSTSESDRRTGTKMVDNAEGTCRLEVKGDSLALISDGGGTEHYRKAK